MAVLDVAVGEYRGGLERLVRDLAAVMGLVAVAEATQDLHGLVDRRLLDAHLLEAALEGGVALEVLAVLVERRRADRLQLAARERGLQDRGGVDRALGGACLDEIVELLVDEQDDVAALHDLLHDLLQALLEFPAANFRAGNEGGEVERVDSLALQELGTPPDAIRWASPSTTAVLPTPGSPISTGLFFWRRERICMIRSISVCRPTTGSSQPSEACFVKLRPNWSRSFELFVFSPPGAPAPAWRRPGPESMWMISLRIFRIGVEVEQDARGDALVLAHEAEEDVLGADVVVPEREGRAAPARGPSLRAG